MIEIKFYASLREGRNKSALIEPDSVKTCSDVLEMFNIKKEEAAIFLVNGFHAKLTDTIKDGDILAIFPPVAGG